MQQCAHFIASLSTRLSPCCAWVRARAGARVGFIRAGAIGLGLGSKVRVRVAAPWCRGRARAASAGGAGTALCRRSPQRGAQVLGDDGERGTPQPSAAAARRAAAPAARRGRVVVDEPEGGRRSHRRPRDSLAPVRTRRGAASFGQQARRRRLAATEHAARAQRVLCVDTTASTPSTLR